MQEVLIVLAARRFVGIVGVVGIAGLSKPGSGTIVADDDVLLCYHYLADACARALQKIKCYMHVTEDQSRGISRHTTA